MHEPQNTGRLLLTVPEAALMLGIGRSLCYEMVLRGELPSIKLGRARRIPATGLDTFIAQRAQAPLSGNGAQ